MIPLHTITPQLFDSHSESRFEMIFVLQKQICDSVAPARLAVELEGLAKTSLYLAPICAHYHHRRGIA